MEIWVQEQQNYDEEIYDDLMEILKAIGELCYTYQPAKYPMSKVNKALWVLYSMKKTNDKLLTDYQHRFSSAKDIFLSLAGWFLFGIYA